MLLVIIILFIHIVRRKGREAHGMECRAGNEDSALSDTISHPPIPNFYLMSAGNMASRLSNEKEHLPLNFLVSEHSKDSDWLCLGHAPNLGPVTVAG